MDDLWLLIAVAAIAGITCLYLSTRPRPWRWLTAAVGSALIFIIIAMFYLAIMAN